jgi:sugar-specific transcriptional regulator TrmB
MEDLINELGKNYNIPDKQLRILKALEFKDLTAREISKKTQIPIGRLYDYLNALLTSKLIDKTKKKPCKFSFKEKNEKVYAFVKNKFEEAITKESTILSVLEKSKTEIKLITSKEDYIFECRRIYGEENNICFIERIMTPPYYLYPEDYADYKKVREYIGKKRNVMLENTTLQNLYKDSYFENLNKGKKFIGIANKNAIISFVNILKKTLDKEKFESHIRKIINLLKTEKVSCRLCSEAFPYYMITTKNYVFLCFNMPENITGLLVRDVKAAQQFKEFFDSIYQKSEPLLPILEKLL